jgi:protein SCO1/2
MSIPLTLFLGLLVPPDVAPSRLAIIRDAPQFTLTTQQDEKKNLKDFRGKVLLVTFIFTTCSGSCPATTSRMAQLQVELKRRGDLPAKPIHFVSITLDPERDTPEALRRYVQLYDLDAEGWTFFTGKSDEVMRTVKDWGMWARPAANAQLDHPSRVFLVDPKGRIREIYNLEFFKTPWVIEDIELLLREN